MNGYLEGGKDVTHQFQGEPLSLTEDRCLSELRHRNDESGGRELESWDVVFMVGQGQGLLGTLSGQDSLVDVGAASTILGLTTPPS